MDAIEAGLVQDFIDESAEGLQQAERCLVAYEAEHLLEHLRNQPEILEASMIDLSLESLDFFNKALEELRSGAHWPADDETVTGLRTRVSGLLHQTGEKGDPVTLAVAKPKELMETALRHYLLQRLAQASESGHWTWQREESTAASDGETPKPAANARANGSGDDAGEYRGNDFNLDKGLVEFLEVPLTHLVRNIIDHGIEEKGQRGEKDPSAQVVVFLEEEDQRILLEVSDDGRDLNYDFIRFAAIERGIIRDDQERDHEAVVQGIFAAGVSTAQEVSEISGRGVGLDVVHANAVWLPPAAWLRLKVKPEWAPPSPLRCQNR